MIKKERGKFVLRSKTTGAVLGTHDSREDAVKQEQAINISKLKRARAWRGGYK